jgi:tetrahydromethanopterin S-methyltransferase subunit C
MEQRPMSLTIIAWVLIALTALGLVGAFTMGSNPAMTKALEQMHMSLAMYQAWVVINSAVTLVCAYGFLKGYPWSRVLYVVWGVIGLVVGYSISPMKAAVLISLVVLVVVAFFLFRENANDWFQARGFMLKREVAPSQRR